MSQQNVRIVITRIVITRLPTDDELRMRFALDPFDTLAELHLQGLALTPDEIDVFVQSDVRLWFVENGVVRGSLH